MTLCQAHEHVAIPCLRQLVQTDDSEEEYISACTATRSTVTPAPVHCPLLCWKSRSAKAMYSGICICVLLAVLSTRSTGEQTVGSINEDPGVREIEQQNLLQHPRHIRGSSSGQLKAFQRIDGDQKANFGTMLAKYLQARKGSSTGRYAVLPSRPVIDPTHRINDRDYMGWMDFGRRSAEEYEYSS